MKDLKKAFLFNESISKQSFMILVWAQVFIALLIWMFSPFVFLPTPAETYKAFLKLWSGGVVNELMISLHLNIKAIGVATLVSLILSYLTTIPFFRPIVGFLSKLRFLSMVGLTFFFTMIASNGHTLKLYLLVFSISVFFITSMADVLNSIPKVQFDLARTLRMSRLQIVWEVIILGQMDKVFDVIRQNAAISWLMITMVEGMSRSEGGIGTMLLNQNKHFQLSAIMAIQIMILVIGLLQDYLIGFIKTQLCPYATITTEKK